MDSAILDQLSNLEKEVDSEITKTRKGNKKKMLPAINEVEESDIKDKRERLVTCVLSRNSKQYLGKEYTQEYIDISGVSVVGLAIVGYLLYNKN